MYLAPTELALGRDQSLHNLQTGSLACIEAGERLAELFSRHRQQTLSCGAYHMPAPAAAVREVWNILGDTHSALLRVADEQVRLFDRIAYSLIERARRSVPWEGEFALRILRTTLEGTENTLHEMTEAAIQAVEIAERGAIPAETASPPADPQ